MEVANLEHSKEKVSSINILQYKVLISAYQLSRIKEILIQLKLLLHVNEILIERKCKSFPPCIERFARASWFICHAYSKRSNKIVLPVSLLISRLRENTGR